MSETVAEINARIELIRAETAMYESLNRLNALTDAEQEELAAGLKRFGLQNRPEDHAKFARWRDQAEAMKARPAAESDVQRAAREISRRNIEVATEVEAPRRRRTQYRRRF